MIAISAAKISKAMMPPETRLRYRVATALASTSFGPTLSRVMNADGLVSRRPWSKNSSSETVLPTVTMSDGAVMVDEQQREIGRRSGRREGHRADTEVLNAFESGSVTVRVGGQHHLGTGFEGRRADLVRITDDQIGAVSGFGERVRTRVRRR